MDVAVAGHIVVLDVVVGLDRSWDGMTTVSTVTTTVTTSHTTTHAVTRGVAAKNNHGGEKSELLVIIYKVWN